MSISGWYCTVIIHKVRANVVFAVIRNTTKHRYFILALIRLVKPDRPNYFEIFLLIRQFVNLVLNNPIVGFSIPDIPLDATTAY